MHAYITWWSLDWGACAFSSFTAWFSLIKCIKNDHKIQDMGQKMRIYISFHMVKIKWRVPFVSSKNKHDYKCDILYNSSINKLILRDLCFRHHIACFCSISPTKNYSKQLQHCFASLSNMTIFSSWMNQPFKWFGSVAMTHLLTVTCCHLQAI